MEEILNSNKIECFKCKLVIKSKKNLRKCLAKVRFELMTYSEKVYYIYKINEIVKRSLIYKKVIELSTLQDGDKGL